MSELKILNDAETIDHYKERITYYLDNIKIILNRSSDIDILNKCFYLSSDMFKVVMDYVTNEHLKKIGEEHLKEVMCNAIR